jgi:hypothetical protein
MVLGEQRTKKLNESPGMAIPSAQSQPTPSQGIPGTQQLGYRRTSYKRFTIPQPRKEIRSANKINL